MDPARILSLINAYAMWLYAVGLLALLFALYELQQARKNKIETIFSLEKEFAAARERRARNTLIIVLALLALLTWLKFTVVPSQPLPPLPEATATRLIFEPPTAVPIAPTLTRTRIPTRPRPTGLPPTETPTPTRAPPPPCPQPGVCITSPRSEQVIAGEITVQGTANIEAFQFYKVEYGLGENPEPWHSIGDVRGTPVVDGALVIWNTTGFPNGTYTLRLTVVDMTGNFAPPFAVRVIVQN